MGSGGGNVHDQDPYGGRAHALAKEIVWWASSTSSSTRAHSRSTALALAEAVGISEVGNYRLFAQLIKFYPRCTDTRMGQD